MFFFAFPIWLLLQEEEHTRQDLKASLWQLQRTCWVCLRSGLMVCSTCCAGCFGFANINIRWTQCLPVWGQKWTLICPAAPECSKSRESWRQVKNHFLSMRHNSGPRALEMGRSSVSLKRKMLTHRGNSKDTRSSQGAGLAHQEGHISQETAPGREGCQDGRKRAVNWSRTTLEG